VEGSDTDVSSASSVNAPEPMAVTVYVTSLYVTSDGMVTLPEYPLDFDTTLTVLSSVLVMLYEMPSTVKACDNTGRIVRKISAEIIFLIGENVF
jgi:hypothetical protein